MSTIYRKYRPQRFSDVTGQSHIIKTITNAIAADKTAHAYLFSGPRGIGKTTTARLLAKAINCQNRKNGDFEPCEQCSSCMEITNGNNIDVIEIDAASNTGVENVRENIIENAQFKPTKSKSKIFIIDEVHMLSTSAFNALLKTLEEPPAHIVFILATTELHKLPATIISRCQRFNFKKVPYQEMLERLQNICQQEGTTVVQKVLEKIINKSDGCMRDAESLLGQILSIDLKEIGEKEAEMILPTSNVQTVIDFLQNIINKNPAESLKIINQCVTDGISLEQFSYDAVEILRSTIIIQADPLAGNFTADYSNDVIEKIKKFSKQIDAKSLIQMIEALILKRREIKSSPMPQLPLELFAINFGLIDNETVKDLPDAPKSSLSGAQSKNILSEQKNNDSPKQTPPTVIKRSETIKTTLQDLQNRWEEIVDKISAENHSLTLILKTCVLKSLDASGLHIAVPYSFHKDRLEETKARKTISACFLETFGEEIPYACIIHEDAQEQKDDLNDLATDFGGEIIE